MAKKKITNRARLSPWSSLLKALAILGAIFLIGYFVGKWIYGSVEGSRLAGFDTWETVYQEVLFLTVKDKGTSKYLILPLACPFFL